MTACIGVTNLSTRGQYPVLDPRRTAGSGPFKYGYSLAGDGIIISVARSSSLSSCSMQVDLVSSLQEPKDILAWNLYSNSWVDRIGSAGLGVPSTMTIRKASTVEQGCGQGADTVVMRRKHNWPEDWKAWYWFPPTDFWDFWGGCRVTFEWISDTARGQWADQIPAPTYPQVRQPDGTLVVDSTGSFNKIFGGSAFNFPSGWLRDDFGRLPTNAIPAAATDFPPFPADFTLLREYFTPEVYVIFGGSRFRIPDGPTLYGVGFDWRQVRSVPTLDPTKFRPVPIDGTLLREQNSPGVFLAENGQLRAVPSPAVMDGRCLPWRHIRIVPDGSLATMPQGPPLN